MNIKKNTQTNRLRLYRVEQFVLFPRLILFNPHVIVKTPLKKFCEKCIHDYFWIFKKTRYFLVN